MKNKLNIKTKERMIHVTDDWHPCFEGGFVHCRVSLNYFNGYYIITMELLTMLTRDFQLAFGDLEVVHGPDIPVILAKGGI